MRPLSYANTSAFLLCFDVTSPASFENVGQRWFPELHHFCPNVPIVLVGTKADMRNDAQTLESLRKRGVSAVGVEACEAMAKRIGAVRYIECSAKTGENMKEVFDEAIRAVVCPTKRGKKGKKTQGGCALL